MNLTRDDWVFGNINAEAHALKSEHIYSTIKSSFNKILIFDVKLHFRLIKNMYLVALKAERKEQRGSNFIGQI